VTTVDPFGVPAPVLQSLPIRFDLRQVIESTFDILPTLIMTSRTKLATSSQTLPPATLTSTGEAITDINAELHLSLCVTRFKSKFCRPRCIVDAYQILILIFSAFLDRLSLILPSKTTQTFCVELVTAIVGHSPYRGTWGRAVITLFESLLNNHGTEKIFSPEIAKIIDASILLNQEDWISIRQQLLSFLLNNKFCEGRIQDLWKVKLGDVGESVLL
jgi:hypothetical protein